MGCSHQLRSGTCRSGLTTGFHPRHDEQGDGGDAEQHERVLGGGLAAVGTTAPWGEQVGVGANEQTGHEDTSEGEGVQGATQRERVRAQDQRVSGDHP